MSYICAINNINDVIMENKIKVVGLGGLIFQSTNPDRLADFYKQKIGLPLELRTHGGLYEHWECDYHNIHFAILKTDENTEGNAIVASFIVDDIETLVGENNLTLESEILALGGGSFVGRIKDPDGNRIHLWMNKNYRE
ncbi:MAG: VOC family protein [Bacteroidetes bacterium]|nr:VOC family protein [Bacteroidota bacterium]